LRIAELEDAFTRSAPPGARVAIKLFVASMENLFRGKCENIEGSAFIAHDVVRREERVFNARERAGGPAVD